MNACEIQGCILGGRMVGSCYVEVQFNSIQSLFWFYICKYVTNNIN